MMSAVYTQSPTSGVFIMPSNPLVLEEREEIRAGIERGESCAYIAKVIERHRCTVSEEIRRNGGRSRYRAVRAQRGADMRRARPKMAKLVADTKLARYVTKRLELKDSPLTISIELARGVWGVVASISHECIYQSIYNPGRGLEPGLHCGLHLKRRRRKRRGQHLPGGHSLGDFNPIKDRPAIADLRVEVGHLEGDLIVGAYNRSALITLFDRMSRYLWLQQLTSKSADACFEAMLKLLGRIPPALRRTITWDQGAEMARHAELSKRRNVAIYIADPKAPWQRPTNENGNAFVRRYVGKSTDLSIYTTKDLRRIERRINTTPRRSLNWATANDIYTHAVAMTT